MMFADLIDEIDFIEHLQTLGLAVANDASLAEIFVQVQAALEDSNALREYLVSLTQPQLNVHPDVIAGVRVCLDLQ